MIDKLDQHLFCTVQRASVGRAAEVVHLYPGLNDVCRVDSHPVGGAGNTASQHHGAKPQLRHASQALHHHSTSPSTYFMMASKDCLQDTTSNTGCTGSRRYRPPDSGCTFASAPACQLSNDIHQWNATSGHSSSSCSCSTDEHSILPAPLKAPRWQLACSGHVRQSGACLLPRQLDLHILVGAEHDCAAGHFSTQRGHHALVNAPQPALMPQHMSAQIDRPSPPPLWRLHIGTCALGLKIGSSMHACAILRGCSGAGLCMRLV